jgi:hypothetical protein
MNQTPKEKAVELVEKIYQGVNTHYFTFEHAKQCALIAVDEILKIDRLSGGWGAGHEHMSLDSGMKPYWIQVKEEINKL